jgi:hypothetical protein
MMSLAVWEVPSTSKSGSIQIDGCYAKQFVDAACNLNGMVNRQIGFHEVQNSLRTINYVKLI